MFSFHKPKIYRSNRGCCICRAKSSSSRFTDSSKYEQEFEKCFRIGEKRCGEICNACVLLVKRWKKLPDGTNRHWNHVVDARAGPGTKSLHKMKNKLSPNMQKHKSPLQAKHHTSASSPQQYQPQSFSSIPSPPTNELSGYEDSLDKSDLSDSDESDMENSPSSSHIIRVRRKSSTPSKSQISPFLDLTYWKMTQICCGTIFKGMSGEVLVDPQLFKPCWSCNKKKTQKTEKIKHGVSHSMYSSVSLEDTDSNSSAPSFSATEFFEANIPDPETLPESPPISPKTCMSESDLSATKINFVANQSISMEY